MAPIVCKAEAFRSFVIHHSKNKSTAGCRAHIRTLRSNAHPSHTYYLRPEEASLTHMEPTDESSLVCHAKPLFLSSLFTPLTNLTCTSLCLIHTFSACVIVAISASVIQLELRLQLFIFSGVLRDILIYSFS